MPENYLILIQPKPGKAARVDELLDLFVEEVKANEPDVPIYHLRSTEDYMRGEKTFFIHMAIKDDEILKSRSNMPHHQKFSTTLEDEALVGEIKYLKMSGHRGFIR